jgi:Sec63 Brl domain
MLVAAERLPIQDFSLRVEQSEIVEVALRVLSALQSLCIERKIGCLLETAILVDRAIRVRMWEADYGSIFFQCQGLSDLTKKGLNERHALTINDLHSCSQFRVQDLLACSAHEAKQVLLFTSMCNMWSLDLRVDYGHSVDGMKSCIQIDILRANTVSHNVPQAVQRSSFGLSELNPPHFQLICYHAQTSILLCHRRLDFSGVEEQNRSIDTALLSYTVPLPADMFLGDVKCVLLSSVVGLDTALLPRGMAPQSVVSKVKKQSKGTNPSSANAVKTKNDTEVAVGSRILIEKNIHRNYSSINCTDGDVRTWMVKKADEKSSNNDLETDEVSAKPAKWKSKGASKLSKSSNVARLGKVGRNDSAHKTDDLEDSTSGTNYMMDFTRSGYDDKKSSDYDYFGRFNQQSFPPTPANCIVSSSHVGNEDTTIYDLSLPRQRQQQQDDVKQLHPRIISDNAFLAYASDDNDDESSTQEYSHTYRKQLHLSNEGAQCDPSTQGINLSQASNIKADFKNPATYSLPSNILPTQQIIIETATSRADNEMNISASHQHENLKNSTKWVRSLDSGQNYYNGSNDVTDGSRYSSVIDDNSWRSVNDYQDRQNSEQGNLNFLSSGNMYAQRSQRSQSELTAPSGLSGSTGRSSVGGGSSELAMLRRKNIELQLDTIPVKRMRTAASPGFLRPESALKQRAPPLGASIVYDLKPAGKLRAEYTEFDVSWSDTKEFDPEMRNESNVDYHLQYSRNPHQSDQSSGSQDIEILNYGPPFQGRRPTSDYDHLKHDRILQSVALSNDRHALSSFFDDEATGTDRADSKFHSDELYPWEIDRIRSNQYDSYEGEKCAKSSEGIRLERLLATDAYDTFQSSQGHSPRKRLSTPQHNAVQKTVVPPNRNLHRHEVTPIQESNRPRQAPTKLWNDSTLAGISKIPAVPVDETTYPHFLNIDLTIDHLPNDKFCVGNLETGEKKVGESSKEFKADEPQIRLQGSAYSTGRGGNQTSNSSHNDESENPGIKIAVMPSRIKSIRKAEDDDLFDFGFF